MLPLLTQRDRGRFTRQLYKLQNTKVKFTAKRLQVLVGLQHCSILEQEYLVSLTFSTCLKIGKDE